MADQANGTNVPSKPDYERKEFRDGKYARGLCHDLMAGTTAIRAGGEAYLPKWPAEKPEHYKIRAAIVQVARYYQRTVQAAVGMILATPPKLESANAQLLADWEDIDGKGTHGEVFTKHLADDGINGGFVGILVDAPPVDMSQLTHEDEGKLGLRPFWVTVLADHVISWVVDVPDWKQLVTDYLAGKLTADQVAAYAKQTVVHQVVIYEPTDVTDGTYGTTCRDRYRVLRLTDAGVTFEVWEKQKKDDAAGVHFERIADGMMMQGRPPGTSERQPFREIPLAVVYAGRLKAPFVADPPFLALAELNLDHYQVSADRRYLMRLCHAPTLYLFGIEEELADDDSGQAKRQPVKIGPNAVVTSTNANAKMGYASASADALLSSKEEKEELVRQMAVLGMSFIGKDKRGMAETATGRALDDAAENASHATVARGLQDGLEQAWRFHAMYRGVDAPSITVNTSYASPQVDPQVAALLWNAVAADKLPIDVFVHYIRTGELPDDAEVQIETLRLIQNENANADAQKTDAARTDKTLPPKTTTGDPTDKAA